MAILKAPLTGYRLRLRSGKPSKVHLRSPESVLTICKFITDDTEKVDLALVPAQEICKKCLGAMTAVD